MGPAGNRRPRTFSGAAPLRAPVGGKRPWISAGLSQAVRRGPGGRGVHGVEFAEPPEGKSPQPLCMALSPGHRSVISGQCCQEGKVPDRYAETTGERILQKWLPEMRRDRRFLFKFYSMMAKDMARCGKRRQACRFLCRAYFLNPMRLDMLGRMMKLVA